MASLTGMLKYKGVWNSLAELKEAVLSETELIDETPDQMILRIRAGFVSLSFVQREDGTVLVEELRREHYDGIKARYHL